MLLDEAMGKVCRLPRARAVTAEIDRRIPKPVSVEQEIVLRTRRDRVTEGRNLFWRRDSQ